MTSRSLSDVTASLEKLLTFLAKQCLTELPEDVDRFCLDLLARKLDMHVSKRVQLTKEESRADEDLRAIEEDVKKELVSDFEPKPKALRHRAYQSSDESEEDVKRVASYQSADFRFDPVYESDDSEIEVAEGRVKTAHNPKHDASGFHAPRPVCYLFSKEKISDLELDEKTKRYKDDDRMKSLFQAWDGDDSGAVDFVELVLALHKFKEVANAGIDIQVASDALLEFVESDTERELKLSEFTRVIILFALNNFNADFEDVADHMLDVATSTSEAAVLQAKIGVDTTEIEAADKAEEEFLRETVKGMEEQVTDSIRKLRTKRVALKHSE